VRQWPTMNSGAWRIGVRSMVRLERRMAAERAQVYCRLDIPYPDAAGPGGPFRIIGYATPVDESSCLVFFWRFRQVSGIARESWRFLYRATLEKRHWHVLEQDHEMLTNIPPDAHKREMLYQHDVGVARMRRMLMQQAKTQLEAEAAASVRTAM